MKIVIDFRITYNNGNALGIFTREFWQDMALLKYDHEFIILSDEKISSFQPAKNMQLYVLKRTNIKWMDKRKLNKALHAWEADRLITVNETGFTINQFYKKKETGATSAQSGRVIKFAGDTGSSITGSELPQYGITTIQPACRTIITSLSWAETESIKTQYAGGKAFFLFMGDISEHHRLTDLLKAFSIFKKWQQSNMQLVIAGYTTRFTGILEEKLLTYKYRSDVMLLKNPAATELAKLVAACYAVVYPVSENIFPLAVIWAVQSNKAVVATGNYLNRQITGAAEWVDDENTVEGFAKAMILLYKDESRLQQLVHQAKEAARQFSRPRMLEEAWRCIAP